MSRRTRNEVVFGLMRAWRAARLQTDLLDDTAFHKIGINRTDGRCLDALSEGPMTATTLAQACGISPNALTTVVDRLAERGLVERVKDPTDRRRVVVRLTALADHISTQLYGPVVQWSLHNFEKYSTDELELIEGFINSGREFQAEHVRYINELELSWDVPDAPTTDGPGGG
ncbi:MarR family winged helix-turn-helix transcriptional regulator [Micromonospora sp. CNB394]|uniref:MarR family winged helix-turn-helix transcriptional regulator n=1 Tax=Micromonospora sp. CNB394 TaxID=1169151 RepID=UPI0009DC048E|nr:MarR family transcriptional regulator [Micromonospora sp. CNB394]